MSFLDSLVSVGKAALQRMSAPSDPNAVKSASASELASVSVVGRESCLVLYGPREVGAANNKRIVFEVVAHSEKNSFRCGNRVFLVHGHPIPKWWFIWVTFSDKQI